MILVIKNQLHGEILVAAHCEDGRLRVTVSGQNTWPPVGAQPIRMGETENVRVAGGGDFDVREIGEEG